MEKSWGFTTLGITNAFADKFWKCLAKVFHSDTKAIYSDNTEKKIMRLN